MSEVTIIYYAPIDLFFTKTLYGEDVMAKFNASYDYPDRSVGYWGGWDCDLISVKIGEWDMPRTILVDAIGSEAVKAIEERVAQDMCDNNVTPGSSDYDDRDDEAA